MPQSPDEAVDVAGWEADKEYAVYPVGARDKTLLYSPDPAPYSFLVPGHRHLFKHSFHRHADQFWTEVIAYRIGCLLGVPVPPAFVAYDSDNGVCGALIEWFIDYQGEPEERYVPGGDILTDMIDGYDRKHGEQHNFDHIFRYHRLLERTGALSGDWLGYWCDVLLFDALIGNTDRHQDNWGLLWGRDAEGNRRVRPAPAFDNGTSLGYEILEEKMPSFGDHHRISSYVARGRHHMRWRLRDDRPPQHAEMLTLLVDRYPELAGRVHERLISFDLNAFTTMMNGLTAFEVPVPLSAERADFVIRLTRFRLESLMHQLLP